MNALFEDAGKFHTGRVMSETDTSLQIELASGKRSKVKAANVLLRFEQPDGETLLASAEAIAREIDLRSELALALDAEQRRLDDLLGRLAKAPLAETAKVVRCRKQAQQRRRFLGDARLRAEVVARQLGERELAFGSEFPCQ